MKNLSIIVPVYNVEQYIRPCMESVFRQGLDDDELEVILVNDGTLDDSFGRIADIIASHRNIIILEQANQGLSAARNIALSKATGEYVLFLDSDDLLADGSLKPLLLDACSQHPDLAFAQFAKLSNEEIASYQPVNGPYSSSCQPASQLFLHFFDPRECYVWRALYRRAFLDEHQLRFIPGIYFEDVPFTVECYLKAGKCIKASHTLYIYRQRAGSIVSTIDRHKITDFNEVIAQLWRFWETMALQPEQRHKLMDTIFAIFSVETWHIANNPELLRERKRIMDHLKQRVPDLRFTNGLKQRLVSLCYHTAPSAYIQLKSLSSRCKTKNRG